jgi:hypothetical protein
MRFAKTCWIEAATVYRQQLAAGAWVLSIAADGLVDYLRGLHVSVGLGELGGERQDHDGPAVCADAVDGVVAERVSVVAPIRVATARLQLRDAQAVALVG